MMTNDTIILKQKAEVARLDYKRGFITRKEASELIKPYIDAVNNKSKEIAKKYNQRPKTVSLAGYLR